MQKRILSLLLCAAMALPLTACDRSESGSETSDGVSDASSEETDDQDGFEKRTSMFEFLPPIDKQNSEDEFICEPEGVGVKITGTTARGNALWIPDKLYDKPVLGINLPDAEFEEIIMPDTVQIFSLNFSTVKYINIPRNIQYDHPTDGYDAPALDEIALEAIYFDDGVSEITRMAVGGSLKRVSLPDDLTALGEGAFAYCSGLTELVLPDSVKKIDPTAFEGCENIRVKYGGDIYTYADRLDLSLECTCDENGISHTVFVQSYGSYEEETYDDRITYCSRKTENITIPANMEIDFRSANVFSSCDKLQSIEVDSANTKYYSRDGVLFQKSNDGDILTAYPNAKPDKSYAVPDDVRIRDFLPYGGLSPFSNCIYLQNLEVSAENESYSSEDGVVYNKDKTQIIAFPGGKTKYEPPADDIGMNALRFVRGLKSITVSDSSERYSSADGVLYDKDKKSIYVYPLGRPDREFTLPDSVENIAAIGENPNLRTIIYNGKPYAREDWDKLDDVMKYGESGVLIDSDGAVVTGVSQYAEEIVIPDDVADIADDVFKNRDNLKSIKYKNKTYTLDNIKDLYTAVRGEEGLTITSGGVLTEVSSELTEVKIPDRVTEIYNNYDDGAFKGCDKVKKVTFGKGVTTISGDTYYGSILNGCPNVTEVIVPEGVTSIDWYAFANCGNLKKVTLPGTLNVIGLNAFVNCHNLTDITIPDSVTSIDYPYEVGSGIPIIPVGAFGYCENIKVIYKGKTYDYTHIDDLYEAINGSEAGSAAAGGGGMTVENNTVVSADKDITRAVIPQGVERIGESAFYSCTKLTEVIIPDTVTFIGAYAFSDCTSLREITLPDSVTECQIIKGGAREPHPFYNCYDLTITYKGKAYTNTNELYAAVNGS